MKTHELRREQYLPYPREQVFEFFSDARNLEELTPPFLRFEVLTPGKIPMHPGALIDYRLRVHGFPIRWRSRISTWQPPHRFIDEQIRGPYRLWHHEHVFEEREGGTLCLDHVRYAVPFDWFSHRFIVRPDIERIFAFRYQKLQERFPSRHSA